jgi:glucan 1,3-beta-glucosidase
MDASSHICHSYLEAYDIVRNATGAGNGPTISYHEAFMGLDKWQDLLPGADNIGLDFHPYVRILCHMCYIDPHRCFSQLCFANQPSDDMPNHVNAPCQAWGSQMNNSMDTFGLTAAGEFSLAITDCGTFVNGVDLGTRYEGDYKDPDGTQWSRTGSCDRWVKWQNWDDTFKKAMNQFAQASFDSLQVSSSASVRHIADLDSQNWFFWTWKIGNSTDSGTVESPAWSYQLGLEQGWIPKDPRTAAGFCKNSHPRSGAAVPKGAGLSSDFRSAFSWPPSSIRKAGDITNLPSYTPTGSLTTLPVPTSTGSASATGTAANPGTGWNNAADNAGMNVEIVGCTYLDPWVSPNSDPPSPLCTSGANASSNKRRSPAHVGLKMQPPPSRPYITAAPGSS